MKDFKQHIIFRIATLFVIACLLTPIVVKSAHIFSDHEHEVCVGKNQSHFHEIDMDCEFFKYKINHNLYFTFINYELKIDFKSQTTETEYYAYLKGHQQLTSFLRGPPSLLM